jgi:predicted methyltransferase
VVNWRRERFEFDIAVLLAGSIARPVPRHVPAEAAQYVVVDHTAAVGTGTSDAQSLHRIEPASVRKEVEAAGFVLDAESTMLANKDDAHSIKVFDPSIKGETDRFAYRFVKP